MTETKYGIKKAALSLPARDLLIVPHKNRDLGVSSPAFGPNTYNNNLAQMQETYSHLPQYPSISFREPTTSESISVVAYDIKTTKIEILDPRWLQLGRIVRTSEGVFVNPPKDKEGNVLTNESKLKTLLDKASKINGIYLGDNEFGFASYETFERGVQDCDTFAQGGLARVLEHTDKKIAKNFRQIASPEFYKNGVNVWGYDKVNEFVVRVASLGSYRDFGGSGLSVGGSWGDDDGCAFGVLVTGEASAKKI